MAHFAELNELNTVLRVVAVHNNELLDEDGRESEQKGIDFCVAHFGGRWIQTSYNAGFRQRYAGVGAVYVASADLFTPPQPYESWTINANSYLWEAPTAMPTDGKSYAWNEATLSWDEITN